jgi:phage terminase large subunit-like protein
MRTRPDDYPKLKDYKPSRFMLPDSHYDKKKADRAVKFIEMLPHTKGEWEGKPFWLLPWQEQIIRDLFGIVKADGFRQFRTAYIEIPKKQGKSELAAAIALYLLYADHEPSAEVFSAAADRQQASIVFDVAKRMVEMTPGLQKRSKVMSATKRIVNYSNAGYYQVVSADVGGKHGYSISGLVFDEIHNQPNRKLWDVLTKGSGDARRQALHVAITTAGTDRNSICFELHTKALDILSDRKNDPTFYPVVYSLPMDADWKDEKNWYKVNPSLGYTVPIERMREAYLQSQDNPAEENVFRTLRLCQWVGSTVQWIPDHIYDLGNQPIDKHALQRRDCYAGLDLSSSGDITALVLMFPPRTDDEKYIMLPFFWVPEETIPKRVQQTSVPYDNWVAQGYVQATPGNVIDYAYIQNTIGELSYKYHIWEIAFDRWGSNMLVERLTEMGLTVVPFGQGYKDMSPASRAFYEELMKGNIIHGGNPVMKWMCGNVVIEQDPAGNIKPTKAKSKDKIDGVVAAIMALDRCIRHENEESVYDSRGLLWI